jgi:hypothetical protein
VAPVASVTRPATLAELILSCAAQAQAAAHKRISVFRGTDMLLKYILPLSYPRILFWEKSVRPPAARPRNPGTRQISGRWRTLEDDYRRAARRMRAREDRLASRRFSLLEKAAIGRKWNGGGA